METIKDEIDFKLTHCIFRVRDARKLIEFYLNNFGMKEVQLTKPAFQDNVNILGYTTNYDENFNIASNILPSPTFLEFHHDDSSIATTLVNSGSSNVYWKIGITLYNVSYAREILQSKQIQVSDPSQFQDIGFVCHLKDPHGFIIELLQHDFEKTFKVKMNNTNETSFIDKFPLGYPCCIGQITLQTNDIETTRHFYQDLLGMKLLSIQEVPEYNFTLYFFCWTNENPPQSNIKDATINREWLWKRPYTSIEIRHFQSSIQIPPFKDLEKDEIGFAGLRITCHNMNKFITKIKANSINFEESNGIYGKEIIIRDPSNVPIHVSENISN